MNYCYQNEDMADIYGKDAWGLNGYISQVINAWKYPVKANPLISLLDGILEVQNI